MGSWAKIAAAVLAFALTALPAAAQVPDPFARELAQKLSREEVQLTENGYARAAGPFAGGLQSGASRRNALMLRAGQDYAILGVCESRCQALDMRVLDPRGALIGQSAFEGAAPVVGIRPSVTGTYEIEAHVDRCRAAQCWYAFNVYSR